MPIQRWRCPAVLRVKSAVFAAIGAVVAVVFFPLWFAVPVAVVFAAWGTGMAAQGSSVALDTAAGLLVLRMGFITRRVRVAGITAVLVDRAKVSIARADGGEISLYAWRKSPLDDWLRVGAAANDIGHAIASAVALAQDAAAADGATAGDGTAADDASSGAAAPCGTAPGGGDQPRPGAGSSPRSRSALATALLGCAGLLGIIAALLVRVSWPNPVLTVLGVLLALILGVAGLFYAVFSLWLLLTRLGPRSARDRASAA